ncbi:tRNA (guanosine(37)-N1)-methyltransferase TrmD [Buchnera aphidicola]|uniref:tRNA (guanosine(37)-N1)-methyltransferase TrmD n=1 Tax=Buchnera aphidicola TaxID=9 RepID=UPI003BEEF17E
MYFHIVTIFPEMFRAITNYGVIGRAFKKKRIIINFFNPRDFTNKKYKSIDDRPYGGGPGMLMSFEPLYAAIQKAKSLEKNTKVIYLSPQGIKFKQKEIKYLLNNKKIIFICGRYKGIDQRIINHQVDEEWSIGDYILTGGELAAMNIIDATSRLIPGVIEKTESIEEDSFSNRFFDYPNYTRPQTIKNMTVPSILLSGHHKNIRIWRLKEAIGKTWMKRPDILKNISLTKEEENLLNEFKNNFYNQNKKP